MADVTEIVAANEHGDEFPVLLEVDVMVRLNPLYQQVSLCRHVAARRQQRTQTHIYTFMINSNISKVKACLVQFLP